VSVTLASATESKFTQNTTNTVSVSAVRVSFKIPTNALSRLQKEELEQAVSAAFLDLGVLVNDVLYLSTNKVVPISAMPIQTRADAIAVDVVYDASVSNARISDAIISLMRIPITATLDHGVLATSTDVERCINRICQFSRISDETVVCPDMALDHFTKPTFGKISTMELIAVISTASSTVCGTSCLKHPFCRGFQVKPSTNVCQLLQSAGVVKSNIRWRVFMRKLFCSRKVAVTSSSSSTTTSSTAEPLVSTATTTLLNRATSEMAIPSPWWHNVLNQSTVNLTTMQVSSNERQMVSTMGFTAIVVTMVFLLVVLLVVCCLIRAHRQATPEQRHQKSKFEEKLSLESTEHENPLYSEIESELTWDGSAIRVHADKRKRGIKVTREKSLKFTNPDVDILRLTQQNRNLESRGQFFDGRMPQDWEQRATPPSRLRPILAVNPSDASDVVYDYGVGAVKSESASSLLHARFQGQGSEEDSATYSTASRAPTEPIYALASKTNRRKRPTEPTKPTQALPFFDTTEMEHFIDCFPQYEAAAAFPAADNANAIYSTASPRTGESVNATAIYATASQHVGEDIIVPDSHSGKGPIYATASQHAGEGLIVSDSHGGEGPMYATASQHVGEGLIVPDGCNATYAVASEAG